VAIVVVVVVVARAAAVAVVLLMRMVAGVLALVVVVSFWYAIRPPTDCCGGVAPHLPFLMIVCYYSYHNYYPKCDTIHSVPPMYQRRRVSSVPWSLLFCDDD
jgi:hypothetical protein